MTPEFIITAAISMASLIVSIILAVKAARRNEIDDLRREVNGNGSKIAVLSERCDWLEKTANKRS